MDINHYIMDINLTIINHSEGHGQTLDYKAMDIDNSMT